MSLILLISACTSADQPTDTADSAPADGGVAFDVVAQPSVVSDVSPTPDGGGMYYIGDAGSALCYVDGTAAAVCANGPFLAASSLDVTADGQSLAMAAVPNEEPSAIAVAGAIVVVAVCSATGWCGPGTLTGPLETLDGTDEYAPVAIDIGTIGGVEVVVFSGTSNDIPGVFSVPVAGGPITTLATMSGVATGVAVATDGTVYAAEGDSLYAVDGGAATAIATGITLGEPAGIALTPDDAAVMVSSLLDGHSAVTVVGRADGSIAHVTDVIDANTGSGGLHRASANPAVYGWCGYGSTGSSTVYRVSFE